MAQWIWPSLMDHSLGSECARLVLILETHGTRTISPDSNRRGGLIACRSRPGPIRLQGGIGRGLALANASRMACRF
jgi:hypothetical protein